MPFSLEQRYKILTHLNTALLRSTEQRANYEDWGAELYHLSAKLNPTEYQANRPRPLVFEKDDIWRRLDKIEAESEFLVNQALEVVSDLDLVESNLKKERSSVNSALKKADVLEWDTSARSDAMLAQRDELIERLRYFLELPPTPQHGGGGASLYRS
ncbi:MAG: hypothetical protein KME29_04665 [Calothrix sp. FI2-JRJ7]|jgi:hypothetical protein|nr:hypothetical protein [Calothrix sp. FI2-JRJ7]